MPEHKQPVHDMFSISKVYSHIEVTTYGYHLNDIATHLLWFTLNGLMHMFNVILV